MLQRWGKPRDEHFETRKSQVAGSKFYIRRRHNASVARHPKFVLINSLTDRIEEPTIFFREFFNGLSQRYRNAMATSIDRTFQCHEMVERGRMGCVLTLSGHPDV